VGHAATEPKLPPGVHLSYDGLALDLDDPRPWP
jgi:hypothetical protein